MENLEKTYLDIDELAKKIEERIKKLEIMEEEKKEKQEYKNEYLAENITNLDKIIKEIDERIAELEEDENGGDEAGGIDIDDLTDKINSKLCLLDEMDIEDDLEKTKYDLEEISRQISKVIKELDVKRKKKKRKKAMYCDMARKRNNQKN